jgi:hypothetical protein
LAWPSWWSAIDDVLRHAIAFSATFVTVLKTSLVEDRIYILLLIGDREGEEMMKKLSVEGDNRHQVA